MSTPLHQGIKAPAAPTTAPAPMAYTIPGQGVGLGPPAFALPPAHCCVCRPRQALALSELHILLAWIATVAEIPICVVPPATPDTVTPFVPASD